MQNFKTNEKGITLIALIITIIVMLILVGVTINVALNGGLFEKGEKAAFQTEASTVKEQLEMAKALKVMNADGKPVDDYSDITVENLEGLDDETKTKYANILVVAKNGDICYNPTSVTDKEKTWLEEIGIKPLSEDVPGSFDWGNVGLDDVITDVDYVLKTDPITYVLNFTEDGRVLIKKDGVLDAEVDAKDQNNINDGKLKFKYNVGIETDIILTMNGENVDAELLALNQTHTYVKEAGDQNEPPTEEQGTFAYGTEEAFFIVFLDTNEIMAVSNGSISVEKAKYTTYENITDNSGSERWTNKDSSLEGYLFLDIEGDDSGTMIAIKSDSDKVAYVQFDHSNNRIYRNDALTFEKNRDIDISPYL